MYLLLQITITKCYELNTTIIYIKITNIETSIFNDNDKIVPNKFHNSGIKTVLKSFHLMA